MHISNSYLLFKSNYKVFFLVAIAIRFQPLVVGTIRTVRWQERRGVKLRYYIRFSLLDTVQCAQHIRYTTKGVKELRYQRRIFVDLFSSFFLLLLWTDSTIIKSKWEVECTSISTTDELHEKPNAHHRWPPPSSDSIGNHLWKVVWDHKTVPIAEWVSQEEIRCICARCVWLCVSVLFDIPLWAG